MQSAVHATWPLSPLPESWCADISARARNPVLPQRWAKGGKSGNWSTKRTLPDLPQ